MFFRRLPQSSTPTQVPGMIWEELGHLHRAGSYGAGPTEALQPVAGSWGPDGQPRLRGGTGCPCLGS